MKNFLKISLITSFLLLAISTGCNNSPSDRSDLTLEGIATEEGSELSEAFNLPLPDMNDIYIGWGSISEYNNSDNYYRITIRNDLKDDIAIRAHVRHEMFHAMTGLHDGEELEYNGVKIAGIIAW